MFPRPNLAVIIGAVLGVVLAAGSYVLLSSGGDSGTVKTVSQPVTTVVVEEPAPGTQEASPSSTTKSSAPRTPSKTLKASPAPQTTSPSSTTTQPPVVRPTPTVPAWTPPTSSPRPTHSDD